MPFLVFQESHVLSGPSSRAVDVTVSRSVGDFNDMFQGIAKRLVAAAIREATKKRELRYKDIMKGVSGGISMMTFL
ncbi:hypothetical protein Tco_0716103 [Tanacetum coccineum]